MGPGPIDPKELLKGLDCFLGKGGDIKGVEDAARIYTLMKDAKKLVSRCTYLNIILQTKTPDVLSRFIGMGGYKLLNSWLGQAKNSNNIALMLQILVTLKRLPLSVHHLKQNNTAKMVKQLSKFADSEELREVATSLVNGWMTVIRSQSAANAPVPAERPEKKRRKEDGVAATVPTGVAAGATGVAPSNAPSNAVSGNAGSGAGSSAGSTTSNASSSSSSSGSGGGGSSGSPVVEKKTAEPRGIVQLERREKPKSAALSGVKKK
ncbi:serine/threonine-protein phosphatase 1 regulatory subunit 10 [Lampetra planeri]